MRCAIVAMHATPSFTFAVRAAMPQYADGLIARWLRELEARGLLESVPGEVAQDLDFTGSFTVEELLQKRGS